jgi:hypothetical protein
MVQNPARIDHPKTASGPESSFSLTRQAQTNRYDRRITTGAFMEWPAAVYGVRLYATGLFRC